MRFALAKRVFIGLVGLLVCITLLSFVSLHHQRGMPSFYEAQSYLNGAFTIPNKTLVIYVYYER